MEWRTDGIVDYKMALTEMDARAAAIRDGTAPELAWLLEHPSLYTAGTSAKEGDLMAHARFPVYQTGRGGEHTYHGPGQRVSYLMLDLKKRQEVPDIKKYIWQLEEWIIRALSHFFITGERREGRVGIWVQNGDREEKIAAIGVRIRRWVTMHGMSINVNPDLSHYDGIIPCGIREHGVTSINKLLGERDGMMEVLDSALRREFDGVFN